MLFSSSASMSEISEGYRLCVFPAHSTNVAVESHTENQDIIITHGIRNISVYDVKNQKLTNDWSVRGEQQITSPAIYSDHDRKFMCVVDGNKILTWNPEETSISKVKGKKVNKPILKLLSVPGSEAFILFKDGSLSVISEKDENFFVEPQLQDSQTVFWTGTNLVDKNLHIICLIETKNGPQKESEVLIYNIDTISKLSSHLKFKMNDSVTWKKGQVFSFYSSTDSYKLNIRDSTGKHIIYVFDNQHGMSAIDVQIQNSSEKAVSAFVQDSQIIVGGLKSGNNKVGIGVWDYKFNIMQSWQPFPENQGEIKQIFYSNKHAYLLLGKEFYVYPITTKPSSIGSALGKMSFSVNQTPLVISKMDTDTDCECEKLLNCLLDKNMKVGSHKFQEQFGKLMKRISEDRDNNALLHNHLAALLRKCLTEKKIPRDNLQQIIEAKIIPGSMCQLLFPSLIEQKELTLLHLCLKHVQDIPEGPLVNCMEWFVNCPDSEYVEANGIECEMKDEEDETECPFCQRKSLYINGILALPHNDVFLVECLKKCKFQTVLSLLEYLQHCLQKISPSTLPQDTNQMNPTISQVVDWISVVLDAHFTQFILSPEAKTLLADLHEVVQEQVKFYDEAASLEAIMSQIKHHGLVAQKRNTGLYSICTLKIF